MRFSLASLLLVCALFGQEHRVEERWLTRLLEANQLRDTNRHEEAEDAYRVVLKEAEQLGPSSLEVGLTLNNLGAFHHRLGRAREAERMYVRGLRVLEARVGPRDPGYLRTLLNLVTLRLEAHRLAEAKAMVRRHLPEPPDPAPDSYQAMLISCLASALTLEGNYVAAEPLYRKAIAGLSAAGAAFREETASALSALSSMYLSNRSPEAALTAAREALSLLEQAPVLYPPGLVKVLYQAGSVLLELRRPDEALRLFQRARDVAEDASLSDHPLHAAVLSQSAVCLRRMGRKSDARKIEAQSVAPPVAASVDISELRLKR